MYHSGECWRSFTECRFVYHWALQIGCQLLYHVEGIGHKLKDQHWLGWSGVVLKMHPMKHPENITIIFFCSHVLSLSPPQPGGVCLGGTSACVSPYGLSLCHRGKSILNKPSEGFLCDTFHFPSSKLQGKLACQEDERGARGRRKQERGEWKKKKNDPTPTIKLTNHCS